MARPLKRETRVLVGRMVGPYLVEDVIGEGAMGSVYVATDVNLKRAVALKVIHASLAEDPRYVERFLREARAAARLDHRNIVQIYAAGTDQAITYLALELVKGGSLRRLLRRAGGRLPPRLACEIAREAALGLGAAHAHGIVHRDVKPDNILVVLPAERAGAGLLVKLTDFGVARLAAQPGRLTQSGFFVGTPGYSSPEQCQAQEVDGRSDLYALGVVLYEMLAGRVPHEAPSPLALFAKIVNEAPPPLRDAAPLVGAEVATIVHRLLEKDRSARYQDAAALAADLERAIAALPDAPLPLAPASDGTAEVPPPGPGGATPPGSPVRAGGSGRASPLFTSDIELEGSPTDGAGAIEERPTPGPAPIAFRPSRRARPAGEGAPGGATAGAGAPRTGSPAADGLLVRIEMVGRLAEGGHAAAALRAASLVARELLADSTARAIVLRPSAEARHAASSGSGVGLAESGRRPSGSGERLGDPLSRALDRVREELLDPAARLRPLPGLTAALEPIRALGPGPAAAADDVARALERRRTESTAGGLGGRPIHPLAVVHLAELGVGLALPWKWDELPGAYDDAIVPLGADGRQQVQAAAAVLAALVAADDRAALREFNAARRIVPVVSLTNVGAIQGTSAGLATLLAMVAAFFGLTPRRGFAASGAIDAATIPPLPPEGGISPAMYERFLEVRIGRVEGVRTKLEALLEQRPDVDLLLLPTANRAEIEADAEAVAAARGSGVELRFVGTVAEVLGAGLFEPPLALRPLRRAAGTIASGERDPAAAALAVALRGARRLAYAAAAAAAVFAGAALTIAGRGVRAP